MTNYNTSYYVRIFLIFSEVVLIGFVDYAASKFLPDGIARYTSMDVFYCLPIIQTARLSALHSARINDTQTSTFFGIVLALLWSSIEMAIVWPDFPLTIFLLNTFTRSVVFTVIGRVILKLWREQEYSRKDTLTHLANRLELFERLVTEQGRSERSGHPYSLLFMDIDEFKSINDLHGHRAGDEALKSLADILMDCSRKVDVAARLGGDEFVLLLPETDEQSCDTLIRRIETAAKHAFAQRAWPISVSIGRTTNTGNSLAPEAVIELADKNMYAVKKLKQ